MDSLLPVFAALSGVTVKRASDERSSDLAEFPGEAPSEKQLKDWLDVVGPKIRQTHGAILRGAVPANLVALKATAEREAAMPPEHAPAACACGRASKGILCGPGGSS